MTLYDVLFNWLQLRLVLDLRPNDEAARISLDHLAHMLKTEYQVDGLAVFKKNGMYEVQFLAQGKEKMERISESAAETLIQFINENPERYEFG